MISAIGSGLTSFGLSVYIFRETGSAFYVSLIALASFLPFLLISVPAGILADKHDRRALMVIGDGFSALGVFTRNSYHFSIPINPALVEQSYVGTSNSHNQCTFNHIFEP